MIKKKKKVEIASKRLLVDIWTLKVILAKAYKDVKTTVEKASVVDNACIIMNRMWVGTSVQVPLRRPQNRRLIGCQRKSSPCREAGESLVALH